MSASIVKKTAKYVSDLLKRQLPSGLTFHNMKHTEEVVKTVLVIGNQTGISKHDLELLEIAAWFHDCGYCYTYINHEVHSIHLATTFLSGLQCSNELIKQVSGLIAATRMPQTPLNPLEHIICDADMVHLSHTNYDEYLARLRTEWATCLNKNYTNQDWRDLNIKFLTDHHYFSLYGQTFFEPLKLLRLKELRSHQ
jgi:uncharacterized protein